jgi:hypothetical protein
MQKYSGSLQMFWIVWFWRKTTLYLSMEFEVNAVQWIGICMMVTGLVLNTAIFVFSYYKIVSVIREQQEKKGYEKKSFPVIRFIFRFRKVLKELTEEDQEHNFELVIAFLKWTLLIAIVMIVAGLLMFLGGFLFQ